MSPSLQHVVKITSFRNEENVQVKIQWQSALSILSIPGNIHRCSSVFLCLPWGYPRWDPVTSSTARRWAPTVAQCPACLSACAARGKPGLDPCSQWLHQKSGRNSAPSRGPFQWPPLALRAVHRKLHISLKCLNGHYLLINLLLCCEYFDMIVMAVFSVSVGYFMIWWCCLFPVYLESQE